MNPSQYRDLLRALEELTTRYLNAVDDPQAANTLLSAHKGDPSMVPRYSGGVEALEELIRNAPRLPEDVTVYRGQSGPLQPRTMRSPWGVSLDPEVAYSFRRGPNPALYEIQIPKGSPGLYLGINSLPVISEQEMLLPPRGALMPLDGGPQRVYEGKRGDSPLTPLKYIAPYKARGGLV